MFTGLVEATSTVLENRRSGAALRLAVERPEMFRDVKAGDSVCVSGVCLTVVDVGAALAFDVVAETARRSILAGSRAGTRVNLERALAVGDRLGGHFVQGHVDGKATLASIDSESVLTFNAPEELTAMMLLKGSVAVDGVSLTLAEVKPGRFSAAVIPHTLSVTTLGDLRPGGEVNVETDMLGKWVKQLLSTGETPGITPEFLREHGFA